MPHMRMTLIYFVILSPARKRDEESRGERQERGL
jgi:hypothetical protein